MNKKQLSVLASAIVFMASCSKAPEKTQSELLLHVPSPDWRDQVIYFVMTDRFNDGDPSNNDQGIGEYDPTHESHYSGGDIQGIIEQIDYIKGLGATALWATPIVANQWWSSYTEYSGYHGYWATDFTSVDKHNGTLQTYQQLSDQLHRNGMYLIKDIVVNHTGNFFNYEGGMAGYDPKDTAQNFFFLEPADALQTRPVQPPFDLIDRNNPKHVDAAIYNWTPSITDYRNLDHQFTYQLATLADINTLNPVVIDTFKQTYSDWIEKAGIDAFRIDTVRYVEHEFFDRFMNDEDGILAAAKKTGREHFLAFGEVFDTSKPYTNDAEQRVASYMGTDQQPILNSIISFPLHHDFKTVFAQGLPTDHLAYRIEQHMQVYRDPYVIPTFIDNHDMERFLASGDIAGFKQALAALLTLPGIPTIYQGSEQAMTMSRQAMFKGGFASDKDWFDTNSELYKHISTLANLRTSNRVFTRGDINIIATDKGGPGVLAYTRSFEGQNVVVLFNTSRQPILVNKIKVHTGRANLLPLFGSDKTLQLDDQGNLTAELTGRAVLIMDIVPSTNQDSASSTQSLAFSTETPTLPIGKQITLSGTSSQSGEILIVKNARINRAVPVTVDQQGEWQYTYKATNLGEESVSLVAYHPESGASSDAFSFTTQVSEPESNFNVTDSVGDDVGPTGTYRAPTHEQSLGQQDILGAEVNIGGDVLQLTLTMEVITDDWIPANSFDNVAFSIFVDSGKEQGIEALPLLNTEMPVNRTWNLGHVVYGWGNTTFTAEGANADKQGMRLGVAPTVTVDKAAKTISFTYRASDLEIESWYGIAFYITTWDITGEGMYRELAPELSDWHFSGAEKEGAKVLDSMLISINK